MRHSKIHVMDYASANETLGSRDCRKICNNTYLQRRSETSIAVLLHATDVVTYYRDGHMVLRTGGWHTPTTRDRINGAQEIARISSLQGNWTVSDGDRQEYYYQEDDITLPDGTQTYGVLVTPTGEVKGCTLVLASLISTTTGVECTNENYGEVISGLALKEIQKLWRKAKSCRSTVIEHCQFNLLPLFTGECTGQGDLWETIFKNRLARGC